MTESQMLDFTRRQMEMAQMEYRQLMHASPDATPSAGMVMKWDRVGGFTLNVSSPTERAAILNASVGGRTREKLQWLEAIYEAFFQMLDGTAKADSSLVHDRAVAEVIRMSVFEGRNQAAIAEEMKGPDGPVSRQYVCKLYSDAVSRVKLCAEVRGLFRGALN